MTLSQILCVIEDQQPLIIEMVNQSILGVHLGNFIGIKKFDERLQPYYDINILSISVEKSNGSICIKI